MAKDYIVYKKVTFIHPLSFEISGYIDIMSLEEWEKVKDNNSYIKLDTCNFFTRNEVLKYYEDRNKL